MTKPDTKQIRELIRKNDNSPNLSITNIIFKKMLQLCRAYDEAQKRISTLGDLLKEVMLIEGKNTGNTCHFCKVHYGWPCKPDCLFKRIQKELGEG